MAEGVWISGRQRTVLDLLDERLASDPDGEYLDVCGAKASAAEVAETANRLANALAALGVGPGDRVATLVENSIEAVLAWWGIVRAGAVAVPVNTAYKGEYLRHQLADSGARVLIVEASLVERARAVAGLLDGLGHVVVIGEPAADVAPSPSGTRYRAAPLGRSAGRRRVRPRRHRAAGRPGHVRVHRRHNRPVQGLHAEPQLP